MNPKNTFGSTIRFLAIASGILLLQQGQALACSTQAWDDTNTGSTVTADAAAVYEGNCGLRLNLGGTSTGWVKDSTPGTVPAVTEYVARFYAYIDDAQLANGQGFTLFNAEDASANELFGLEVKGSASGPVLHLYAWDGTVKEATGDVSVPSGWRAISLHWTTGAGNGAIKLSVDRTQDMQVITGLSNAGQAIDSVNLGVVSGNTTGISGAVDVDAFTSRRTGPTGLMVTKGCSGAQVAVKNTTFLPGTITCTASTALTFDNRVTFDPGAIVTVQAPTVAMTPGTTVSPGAVLDIQIQ
ncbi:hypothetical protein [Thiolapillus sp.]